MNTKIPRGIRNNNPLNIKRGNNFKGEVRVPTDRVFEQFTEMTWGVRAAFLVLRTYIQRYGLKKLSQIIKRWAPCEENNVNSYINAVCKYSRFDACHEFDFKNRDEMISLFQAMCLVENGVAIDASVIGLGYDMVVKPETENI